MKSRSASGSVRRTLARASRSLLAALIAASGAQLAVPSVAVAGPAVPVAASDPDGFSQAAKVLSASGAAGDVFGWSVAIDGDTAVVSSHLDDDNGTDSGSAYVFVRDGAGWTQQAKLLASDGVQDDYFGASVAIDGDTIAVGAQCDDDIALNAGSAYIFTRSGTTWTEQAKVTVAGGLMHDRFGSSISLSGDTLLVGAEVADDKGTDSGASYVFTRSGTTWSQQAKLSSVDTTGGDSLGKGVCVEGDTAIVGAPYDDDRGSNSGSAYVFTRSGTTWSQQSKITAGDGAASDYFGWRVGLSSGTAVVGAWGDNNAAGTDAGAAYAFTSNGTTWTQEAKLTASDGAASDNFGSAVGVSGDAIVVGAHVDDDLGDGSGAAYVFTRSGTAWAQTRKLLAPDGAAGDDLGVSTAISGGTVIAGARWDDDLGADAGSAYFFSSTYGTREDTPISVPATAGVLVNDTDADFDSLTATLVAGPAHGSVSLAADGSFTYTPTADWNGTDAFTYRASDGVNQSTSATVTIAVTPVADAPVAPDDPTAAGLMVKVSAEATNAGGWPTTG
ncbi:MAG: hypothetical protein FDZ70_07535, partial [Actinobacteria bacterium]